MIILQGGYKLCIKLWQCTFACAVTNQKWLEGAALFTWNWEQLMKENFSIVTGVIIIICWYIFKIEWQLNWWFSHDTKVVVVFILQFCFFKN